MLTKNQDRDEGVNMNKFCKILLVMIMIPLSQVAMAEDQDMQKKHHPQNRQGMDMMGGKGGMGKMMDPQKMDQRMKKMQEHMLMMHDLSDKILAEKDPKRRQELKDQQLKLMKAHHMQMMSKMKKMKMNMNK